MNKFVNRTGTNLNRKVFDVTEIESDATGKITKIFGNLFRNDDGEGGTPLEAGVLTNIVKSITREISKEVAKEVIEKYVDYTVEEYDETIPYVNNNWQTVEIIIPTTEDLAVERVKVYNEIFNYNFQFLSESDYISLLVYTKAGVYDPGTYEYNHKFVLKSKMTGEIVKKVYLTLNFSAPSTTPED